MKKEMLINVLQPEECRIAIVEDGILEELYVERTSHESYVGNIYKGRIVNIEPSIQAAFVDFGVGRNGFLHVSDVEPAYYRHLEERRDRERGSFRQPGGRDRHRSRPRPEEDDDYSRRRPVPPRPPVDEPGDDVGNRVEESAPPRGNEPPGERRDDGPGDDRGGRGGKRRRGRRGRGRGRPAPGHTENVAEDAAPAEGTHEHAPEPEMREPFEPEREAFTPDDDRPRPMDSVERRTDEDDGPGAPIEPRRENDDDLLFFPTTPAAETPHRREDPVEDRPAHREPVEERRPPHAHREERPPVAAREDDLPFGAGIVEDSDDEPMRRDDDEEDSNEFDEPSGDASADAEEGDDFEEEHELAFERSESEFGDEGAPPRPRRRDDRRGPGGPGGPRGRGGRRQGRDAGRNGFGRPKPLIQDIFKRGQEVLVQVIKEGIGTKGPTLSTYISIAGRYLVLMPGLNRIGVSRKINDEEQRRRLREVLNELKPPKGIGFIIRTAGVEQSRKELQNDLAYLSRLWEVVVKRIEKTKSPCEIYQESDMITRTIRDTFTNDIDTIWVDEPAAFEHAKEFLKIVMPPRYANRIKLFGDTEPLFHKYGIEQEIARIHQRHVPLQYGGSIVIDQTEALVAIDVNSGNFRADNNAEETAYQMNLQAAKEIARQLRLRDLGGVIVNDFIDMRDEKHRRGVEKAMRDFVKRDRARTKILKISQFGLIEMTRQRIRPSLKRSVYQDCTHCRSTGQVKTCESMSIDVMRLLQLAAHRERIHRVDIRVNEEVATYLLNKKRKEIAQLEESGELQVHIAGRAGGPPEMLEFVCTDNNNNEVKFLPTPEETRPRRR